MAPSKSTRSPAFQFYPSDFLGSTKVQLMSTAEVGAYMLLLCACWQDGSIPSDTERLARLTRLRKTQFERIWTSTLSSCFTARGDRWVNTRLEYERRKQLDYRKRQSENGKMGGRPSKAVGYSGLSQTEAKKSSPSPSPTPSPQEQRDIDHDEGFEQFWGQYPRKVGKVAARAVWHKLKPSKELQDRIVASVVLYARSEQWQRDGGSFIPHPRTYLNGRRWEDEIKPLAAVIQAPSTADPWHWADCPHEPKCGSPRTCADAKHAERQRVVGVA